MRRRDEARKRVEWEKENNFKKDGASEGEINKLM